MPPQFIVVTVQWSSTVVGKNMEKWSLSNFPVTTKTSHMSAHENQRKQNSKHAVKL